MDISATIITLNEEMNIGDCLKSLDFAAEIVVVDSGSSDGTEDICTSFPRVKFFRQEWLGFGKQKNVAAGLAENDWILNIDADERVSDTLRNSIMGADFNRFTGFRVARENYFGRRWIKHCGWYPDYNLRLYNRKSCRFSERSVHETVISDGPVATLEGNLVHFTYEGIRDYLKRMDRYSTLAAEEVVKSGKNVGIPGLLFRPLFTFFKMYVLRGGVLEGYTGLLLSILYSHYTFYKYAKALELKSIVHDRQETNKKHSGH